METPSVNSVDDDRGFEKGIELLQKLRVSLQAGLIIL